MVMTAKTAYLCISDLLVSMRSRRQPSLGRSIITCIKKLILTCSRDIPACLPQLCFSPSSIRMVEYLDVQSWDFWMYKKSFIYFLFSIRQSVAPFLQHHLYWSAFWFLAIRSQPVLLIFQGKALCTLTTPLHRVQPLLLAFSACFSWKTCIYLLQHSCPVSYPTMSP